MTDPGFKIVGLERDSEPLYPENLQKALRKVSKSEVSSSQQTRTGRQPMPFDISAARDMIKANGYHSRCIDVKTSCAVGLGHADEDPADPKKSKPQDRTREALDPLCGTHGWQDLITSIADDFGSCAQGYIEVVREVEAASDGPIAQLHRVPAPGVRVYIENERYDKHYRLTSVGEGIGEVIYAEFGERDALRERLRLGQGRLETVKKSLRKEFVDNPQKIHEIIPIRRANNMSRWYGYPEWLAATPSIELSQASEQHHVDFFRNRGVPEAIYKLIGPLTDPEYEKIKETLKGTIGRGNQFKSALIHLQDIEAKFDVMKLGLEGKADGSILESVSTTLGMMIASIHGVPPLLAGILIPGKLGASNEFPNALMSFQVTVINRWQEAFQQRLDATLGNKAKNGGLPLKRGDFRFRKATEAIDLALAATVGGMRQTLPEAKAQGRDLGAGLKD